MYKIYTVYRVNSTKNKQITELGKNRTVMGRYSMKNKQIVKVYKIYTVTTGDTKLVKNGE